jgi:hypothetical protein
VDYYGFTEENFNKMISLFDKVSITGINQNDAFHEATSILQKPFKIRAEQKGVKQDGQSVQPD